MSDWRKSTYSSYNTNCTEAGWRKSSYSVGHDSGNCAEVGWRKSSRSVNNGNCAEVGWRRSGFCESSQCAEVGAAEQVLVRDTMDRDGVTLAFPPDVWAAFTASLKAQP